MLRVLTILVVFLVVIVAIIVIFTIRGPDLSKFEYLKEPQIRTIPDQKMLVVEVKGDPNETGKDAFQKLFRIYYQLKRNFKETPMAIPRVRWPNLPDTPKEDWIGIYGLPIPEEIERIPEGVPPGEEEVKIAVWKYGEVAEILHIGPYGEETPTISKLMSYVEDNGYEIIGPHEEEYLKGPGVFFKGNPMKYYTIIRYRIKKLEKE